MADIKLFEIEGPEVFLGLDIGVTFAVLAVSSLMSSSN
jgi:hypothetical protein